MKTNEREEFFSEVGDFGGLPHVIKKEKHDEREEGECGGGPSIEKKRVFQNAPGAEMITSTDGMGDQGRGRVGDPHRKKLKIK